MRATGCGSRSPRCTGAWPPASPRARASPSTRRSGWPGPWTRSGPRSAWCTPVSGPGTRRPDAHGVNRGGASRAPGPPGVGAGPDLDRIDTTRDVDLGVGVGRDDHPQLELVAVEEPGHLGPPVRAV